MMIKPKFNKKELNKKIFKVKMIVKMKSKLTKTLIAAAFLICIIAFVTPVMAAKPNRTLFIAKGDDLDFLRTTNLIVGKIEFGESGELPSVQVVFHQKIYDESGEKVYAMKGMLKDGLLINTSYYFYCPIFGVYFINVWQAVGMGKFRTTDTDFDVIFRNSFPITMPNTEGKYVSAPILMFLSPTAEYCDYDPGDPDNPPGSPDNPIKILEQGAWALAAAIWKVEIHTPMGSIQMELPIGPVSCLTRYIEM